MLFSLMAELAGAIGYTASKRAGNLNAFLHVLVLETFSYFFVNFTNLYSALFRFYQAIKQVTLLSDM